MEYLLKPFCFSILFTIGLLTGNAQVKQVDNSSNRANPAATQSYIGFGAVINSNVEYPIEGSPYFEDEYVKGNIYHSLGVNKNVQMRYNIYYDRIEYKGKETEMAIGPDKRIRKVELGEQTLVLNLYEVKGKTALAYFIRQDSGKMTILTKMTVMLKGPQFGKPIEGDVPAKYSRMPDTHYFKIGDGPLIKIQSIKKLIEELPDHREEMEVFARKEKTSTNKPKELIRFSQYYNSLQ